MSWRENSNKGLVVIYANHRDSNQGNSVCSCCYFKETIIVNSEEEEEDNKTIHA